MVYPFYLSISTSESLTHSFPGIPLSHPTDMYVRWHSAVDDVTSPLRNNLLTMFADHSFHSSLFVFLGRFSINVVMLYHDTVIGGDH